MICTSSAHFTKDRESCLLFFDLPPFNTYTCRDWVVNVVTHSNRSRAHDWQVKNDESNRRQAIFLPVVLMEEQGVSPCMQNCFELFLVSERRYVKSLVLLFASVL
jgi:hypothetical protein